jgi:hypothetical protein
MFDFAIDGRQILEKAPLGTTSIISEPNNASYAHGIYSNDFCYPEHGSMPESYSEPAGLHDRDLGQNSECHRGLLDLEPPHAPDASGHSTGLGNREDGQTAESHGKLPQLSDRQYNQTLEISGAMLDPCDQQHNLLEDGGEPFETPFSQPGGSIPHTGRWIRNQIDTGKPSNPEYTGSIPPMSPNPGSGSGASQVIEGGVLVFDSSMRAMVRRKRGPKSQADKDAARRLRLTGGACSMHKNSKKKVSYS